MELVAKEIKMSGMDETEREKVKEEAVFLQELVHPRIVGYEGTVFISIKIH